MTAKTGMTKRPVEETSKMAVGLTQATAVPVLVHKFPAVEKSTEVQLVRSDDSVALAPNDAGRGNQGSSVSRPGSLCFSRPQGKSNGAAPQTGWEDGID